MAAPTDRALVFDLSGPLAHYKKIFATTSALTYPIPPKTSVYGLLAAILGLDKEGNAYLNDFAEGSCRIGIQLLRPIETLRMYINLRPKFGALGPKDNRKPTLMEFVDRPRYRLFVTHTNGELYDRLHELLRNGQSVYTPSLGIANLIASVRFVGEGRIKASKAEAVDSVLPKSRFRGFGTPVPGRPNRLLEAGQYAVEMLPSRDVTVRDSVILDRNGTPIPAEVEGLSAIQYGEHTSHVVLF